LVGDWSILVAPDDRQENRAGGGVIHITGSFIHCVRQIQMSPSVPFTNVTVVGRRAGAEPRRSTAPDRRPITPGTRNRNRHSAERAHDGQTILRAITRRHPGADQSAAGVLLPPALPARRRRCSRLKPEPISPCHNHRVGTLASSEKRPRRGQRIRCQWGGRCTKSAARIQNRSSRRSVTLVA
jgi:hypothetical protein